MNSFSYGSSSSRNIGQDAVVDRALGAAASLGVSLAILRFVVFMYKAAKQLESKSLAGDVVVDSRQLSTSTGATSGTLYGSIRSMIRKIMLDDDQLSSSISAATSTGSLDDDESRNDSNNDMARGTYSSSPSSGNSLYDYIRRIVRRFFFVDSTQQAIATLYNESDGTIIAHQGSCHCESVQFEVLAPRCLTAKDASGKIQYQHTKVPADSFVVVRGKEVLKTYHVAMKARMMENSRQGAHAFCSRCGVHVLYAPSKKSPTVEINVNCFSAGIRKLKVTSSNDSSLSEGVALDGQWEDQQLSTISECGPQPTENGSLHFTFESPSVSSLPVPFSSYAGSDDKFNYKKYERKDDSTTPSTPSTVVTSSDSYVSSIQVPSMDQESSSFNDNGSVTTFSSANRGGPRSVSSLPVTFNKSNQNSRIPRREPNQSTAAASPKIQNQMRYYMRKHLSSPQPATTSSELSEGAGDSEEKSPN